MISWLTEMPSRQGCDQRHAIVRQSQAQPNPNMLMLTAIGSIVQHAACRLQFLRFQYSAAEEGTKEAVAMKQIVTMMMIR